MIVIEFNLNHSLFVDCLICPVNILRDCLIFEKQKYEFSGIKKIFNRISVSFIGLCSFFGLRLFFFWTDFLGSTCTNAYTRHGCTSPRTWQNFTGELPCPIRSTKRLVIELFSLKWVFYHLFNEFIKVYPWLIEVGNSYRLCKIEKTYVLGKITSYFPVNILLGVVFIWHRWKYLSKPNSWLY